MHPATTLRRNRPLALALALGMAAALPAHAEATPEAAPATVTVTGEGQVSRAPDMAIMTLGVSTRGDSAKAALAANSESQKRVIEVLKGSGIASGDMQTSGLNFGPVYEPTPEGRSRVNGYRASNMVTLKLRDIARTGALIDAIVEAGASDFNGLSFDLQEPRAAEDEARLKAVEDARAKATLYAQAMGMELGAPLSLSETGNYGAPGPVMMRAEASGAPVESGQVNLSVNVTIEYALKPAQ